MDHEELLAKIKEYGKTRKLVVTTSNEFVPLTKDDIQFFKDLFNDGKSIIDIAIITGRDPAVVRENIKSLYIKRKQTEEKEYNDEIAAIKKAADPDHVLSLYVDTDSEITHVAKYFNKSVDEVKNIMKESILEDFSIEDIYDKPLTLLKVKVFKDFFCNEGDKFKLIIREYMDNTNASNISEEVVTILKKYPFFARTDKGDFKYREFIMNGEKLG